MTVPTTKISPEIREIEMIWSPGVSLFSHEFLDSYSERQILDDSCELGTFVSGGSIETSSFNPHYSVAPKLPVSLRSGENVKIFRKTSTPQEWEEEMSRVTQNPPKIWAIRWFWIILKCYSHLVALKIASTAVWIVREEVVNSAIHKAAGRPAAVQNDLWRPFCTAVPHRDFSFCRERPVTKDSKNSDMKINEVLILGIKPTTKQEWRGS